MKLLSITFLAVLLIIRAYSQTPDKGVVQVHYNFIHVQDTTHRDKPLTDVMLLVTGKNASLFTSYNAIESGVTTAVKTEELHKRGLSNQEINEAMGAGYIYRQFSYMQYYFFFRDQKFFSKEDICVNGCMVEDRIARPEWKIARDTMSFSGILCQKATARFKGRNWTAWFAPEIPLESGPWKLNGLPGLILEAYDDKKEVQWKFSGMKNIHEGDLAVSINNFNDFSTMGKMMAEGPGLHLSPIALPAAKPVRSGGNMQVTKKEYDKLKTEHDRDPVGFIRAQMAAMNGKLPSAGGGNGGGQGGGGGRGGGSQGGVSSSSPAPARPANTAPPEPGLNNPIELSE